MIKVRFAGDPERRSASFGDLCDWADQIVVCTDRFDCGDDHPSYWRSLAEKNPDKVRHFIVTQRDDPPIALKPFHDRGVLRFVVEHRPRFRSNVYLFRNGDEVRALVGTVRLTAESFRSDLEAMVLVEGSWHDEFACELASFIDRCLGIARVSRADDFEAATSDTFLEIEDKDEQAWIVWDNLLGAGSVDKDSAVRLAARSLRDEGLIDFRRLDSAGPLYSGILEAIDRGGRLGLFDRPARGMVRAILTRSEDYPDWLWEYCLLQGLSDEETSRVDAIRLGAEWAALNTGLAYKRIKAGGRIEVALKRAIARSIRKGRLESIGANFIRRVPRPIADVRKR